VDRDEILRVLHAFEAVGLDYVLIGATAMGVHGLIRATEDIDLFVKATADNIERLRTALGTAYDGDPHIRDISTDDLLGDYPAVRYYPPSGDLYFDILTRLGEILTFESIERERKEVAGTMVWVATPAALYRLKKDTVRAKDREDAAASTCVTSASSGHRGLSLFEARRDDISRRLDLCHDPAEALDRLEVVQGVDHAIEVECDVLVDEDVPEAGKSFERPCEIRRKPPVSLQTSNGLRVVFEAVAAPPPRPQCRSPAGHHQQREQHVVAQRHVPRQHLPR
jgi:hypothetical protein